MNPMRLSNSMLVMHRILYVKRLTKKTGVEGGYWSKGSRVEFGGREVRQMSNHSIINVPYKFRRLARGFSEWRRGDVARASVGPVQGKEIGLEEANNSEDD